jgi:transposase
VSQQRARICVGIDAGKGHHWAAVVDETGATLWSKKVQNDESAILTALGEILDIADEVHWAVDISSRSSALLLALLAAHGQQAVYVPGRTVNRMAGANRGEAKTDARDAYVIAETARLRRDFTSWVQWASTQNDQRASVPCRNPPGPSGRQPATRTHSSSSSRTIGVTEWKPCS